MAETLSPAEFEQNPSDPFPGQRNEVDFYAAETDPTSELCEQSLHQFNQAIDDIIARRYPPALAGQKIIHSLARARISFAGDLPLRHEELSESSSRVLKLLNEFERKSRLIIEENLDAMFRTSPETTVQGLIDGATAEECALRLVGIAAPDAKLYYPSEEDEHNGVDFLVVTDKGSLAVQVKIIRYNFDAEHKMPLIYLIDDESQITEVCDQALQLDSLDYHKGKDIGLIYERVKDSLVKNNQYVSSIAPNGSLKTALMPISTNLLNPRLSDVDVKRLVDSEVLAID